MNVFARGALPPQKQFLKSLTFLQFCSYTCHTFFTLLCSFWSKLSWLSKFLKQNRCDSCGWYSNILLNKQKCGQINRIRARKILRLRWCGLKFEFFQARNFSRETLFSIGHIWSNMARIYTKSGWSERLVSVVFEVFCGKMVGSLWKG